MTAQSSLYRVLPTKGLLFISDRHICFRSSGLATRTMGRTLMMLPIGDVITVARHRAFQPGQHGLIVVVRGHEEVFLEFSSVDLRNECCERLEQMLEEALMRPTADISIGKQDDLILKDLSDKLEATSISTSLPSSSSSDADTQDWESGSVSASMFKSQSSDFLSFLPKQPLHITMLSIGSRGDVQPYIALAKALMADGHRVRIATHDEFSAWIEGHNIEFSAVGGDPAELMRICEQNGTFTVGFVREGLLKFRGWLDDLLLSSWRACHGTDVIIESPSAIAGIHVAEAMQIPYFRAFTMPWTRTRAYPHAFAVPHSKAGGSYNYISYVIFDQVFWRAASRQINRWRQETLRLKSTTYDLLEQHKVPFLYNFSPNLVPKPLDWYEWIHVTGFWFLDNPGETSGRSWAAPDDLVAFINTTKAQKRKLVYIGWGSIVVSNAAAMDECVGEAVRKSGVCAIVSRGWSDRLSENKGTPSEAFSSPDIFRVDSVPHDWLFPQLDAACHHGGAGTLGASLRAGLPTIIKPYFGDQFFWGQQVESLGVGTCVKECTAENLAAALRKATQDVRQIERARQLGERIRSENGVQAAVTAFYRELEYARSLIKTDSRLHTTNSEVQASNTVDGASPSQPHAEELHERSSRAIDAINTPSNRPRSTRSSSADSNWSILSP
ncbi:glycosyltransferase family 1 protein [Tilletiaria anomala UBC 951]|uniref:sterol 3beta-glucosyltransferase n=1 Tax=Tilletiaria anomala (strain ATCC 24038 / CBS 436.72 / UBC 951) TaxID=1037660 RepID=A0A066VCY6_TILAU|nr:glycosyltransferase family 1 protein [Tilletiaria anomala UBC 951]KDN36425.1 glycosyltransferase family 1 protein [Tilletiaria anomala UBC 951]